MDYTVIGDTTNLAARLQQLAEPGTILVSETTSHLIREHVHLEALGAVYVKGKTAPVSMYRIVSHYFQGSLLTLFTGRSLSRFVGRERELAILHELLALTERGEGQAVGIVGEAGVGKSRLIYEFRQRLAGKRVTYLEGHCLSYGHTMPYLPIIDIIRNHCGITESDNPEAITGKMSHSLRALGMDSETWAPYLLHLLGVKEAVERLTVLSPEAIKARVFATLRQMSLHHLAPQDSLTVVHAVVPQLPEAVTQMILREAEGNPFFLEELTRAVAEREALAPDVAVPDTIQGVITARIDRLPDISKRLLQTASVLGRDVPLRLLRAIWEEPDALDVSLQELQRLEFFYEQVGGEDSVYVFKHALTQEVAYASLLISHRQMLHAAAGRALETL